MSGSIRKSVMTKLDSRYRQILVGVLATIVLLAFIGGITGWALSVENLESDETPQESKYNVEGAEVDLGEKQELKIGPSVTGTIGMGVQNPASYKSCSENGNVCVTWENDQKLIMTTRKEGEVTCYDVSWTALSCVSQELKDCINMSGYWYGGFQDWNQHWPMNIIQQKMAPYVASDSYAKMYGGVLERYFLSSAGYGVYIDQDVPLHLSMNEDNSRQLCMSAKYTRYPYINYDNSLPYLNYSICYASDIRKVHDYMSQTYIPRPENIPDEKLFSSPIWSTWAMYKKDINETQLEAFAGEIISNNFPHAQIELDDEWTVRYGDMGFDFSKFPDPAAMVRRLNDQGFRVTIWVHPFFNEDSTSFKQASEKGFIVRQLDSSLPALVSWWRGTLAGILDVTNPDAVSWYLNQLKSLRTLYNISSFKFDAGEVNWLPNVYSVNSTYRNPDVYTQKWAELAYESDKTIRHQEVRVGARTQRLPIFSRMLDRDSTWTNSNGLKTIIPCALTFGLIGYPFVLPDMIGGNAYDASNGLEARNYPDKELFIRWLQVNTFLPAMQFSVPPWIYNDTKLTNESRKLVELHKYYAGTIVRLAREATLTGNPIIRPLWWIAPTDEITYMIDDEFLLGDTILVAPVVNQGDVARDIYLPAGRWKDQLRNTAVEGGKWMINYQASLYELPYFTKL